MNDAYKAQNPLVDLCAFTEMPNHFHLLIREKSTGGTAKYLQRVTTAYTMYFNEKYKRSGALFSGRFKSKLIDDEEFLVSVLHYIHNNPAAIFSSGEEADVSVYTYFWSSVTEYLKPSSLKFVNRESLEEVTGKITDYKQAFSEYKDATDERDDEATPFLIDYLD